MLSITDQRYTGQRWEASLGLYDYNARYYDPALGRFIQADTVVPGAGNPQALNRYAYAVGNPLRYTDPSGHAYWRGDEDWTTPFPLYNAPIERGWSAHETKVVAGALGALTAGVGAETLLLSGVAADAIDAVGWKVLEWTLRRPKLARLLGIEAPAAELELAEEHCRTGFVTIMESADYLAQELPQLEGSYAEAFDGPIQQVTLKAGSVLPRVGEIWGNWFGVQIPESVADAETLYNLAKWGNAIDVVRLYELTQDVTGYLGNVAGGTGNQFFIPYEVEIEKVMRVVAERILQ